MKQFFTLSEKMSSRLNRLALSFLQYGRAFLIIGLCLWAGNYLSSYMPIAIPGSIIGLLLLFLMLALKIIPPDRVRCGCDAFMRYMTILFIPAAMGIMDNYQLLWQNFMPIMVAIVASTAIAIILIGLLAQYFFGHAAKEKK